MAIEESSGERKWQLRICLGWRGRGLDRHCFAGLLEIRDVPEIADESLERHMPRNVHIYIYAGYASHKSEFCSHLRDERSLLHIPAQFPKYQSP